MTSTNTLGLRIMGITLGIVVIGFTLFKGTAFVFSHKEITASPAPSALTDTPLPDIAFAPSSQTQQALPSFSPETEKQVADIVKKEAKNIGTQTKKYVSALPKDIEQPAVLNPKTLEQFINENKGQLLPDLPAGTVKISTTTGSDAIKKYLDSISPLQNKAIVPISGDTISLAFKKQQSGEDILALTPVRASIEKNFTLFKGFAVPKEAVALHTKLLQSSQALINNIGLLQAMKQDTVGGLIGLRNIADLDAVFTDISKQIVALEKKYNLK